MTVIKNYLITGLSGFVGTALLEKFKNKENIKIYYIYRKKFSFKKFYWY